MHRHCNRSFVLIVARVAGRPRPRLASSAFRRRLAFVNVHLKNDRVTDEAIDDRKRHGLVPEHLAPISERLILADVGDAVEDRLVLSN
jgi:hypothetical protein